MYIQKWQLSLLLSVVLFYLGGAKNQAKADAQVNFHGTLIDSPPCTINDDEPIVVDFGKEILSTRVSKGEYTQPINFEIDCSESMTETTFKYRISGTRAGFSTSLIDSGHASLGIAIVLDDHRLSLDEWYEFKAQSFPKLKAQLVSEENTILDGGDFLAQASLVVDYL